MLSRWKQRLAQRIARSAHTLRTCHYCGSTSVLLPPYGDADALRVARSVPDDAPHVSTGTPARWFCSVCESWNHADAQGHPLDVWEREMWDASANPPSHAAAAEPLDRLPSNVFCRTCLTNQTLVTNILADYLPEETHPAYAERLHALPAYRRSLEHRYPLVCATCAHRVNERIRAIDARVQKQYLSTWVRRRASPASGPGNSASAAATYTRALARWKARRVLFYTVNATAALLAALAAHPRFWLVDMSASRAGSLLYPAALAAACVPVTWDPAWRAQEALRQRGTRSLVHGQGLRKVCAERLVQRLTRQALQAGSSALRLALVAMHVYAFVYDDGADAGDTGVLPETTSVAGMHVPLVPRTAVALAILLVLAGNVVYTCFGVQVEAERPLRLVSGPVAPRAEGQWIPDADAESGAQNGRAPQSGPRAEAGDPLAALSLGQSRAAVPLDELLEPRPTRTDEAMDVDSEYPPEPQGSRAHDFPLGPQRYFGPPATSGLEQAFGSAVTLDDGRRAAPAPPAPWAAWSAPLAAVVAAAALAAYWSAAQPAAPAVT